MNPSKNVLPTSRSLPHVMFVQPAIMHYRLPVFDGLAARCHGEYEFSVYGPMDGDQAFGGGQRDYLHHSRNDSQKWFGVSVERLPGIPELVREQRAKCTRYLIVPTLPRVLHVAENLPANRDEVDRLVQVA